MFSLYAAGSGNFSPERACVQVLSAIFLLLPVRRDVSRRCPHPNKACSQLNKPGYLLSLRQQLRQLPANFRPRPQGLPLQSPESYAPLHGRTLRRERLIVLLTLLLSRYLRRLMHLLPPLLLKNHVV